jgi:glucose/arabinose dehydrogenase
MPALSLRLAGTAAALSLLFSPGQASAAAAAKCGGLPGLAVKTPPGFCAAVLSTHFKFPRGVQPMPNGDLIIVDMGAWEPKRGKVWLMKKSAGAYEKVLLIEGLDRPNGIVIGPDGLVYVGAVGRIFRFDPAKLPGSVQDVIGGSAATPPLPGLGRHALANVRFDQNGDLYVNVGSSSDHCETGEGAAPVPGQPCAEGSGPNALGAIRKYHMQWPAGTVSKWEVHAHGLRNSMAMAFQPDNNALWQAENSRDFINTAMPELKNDNELPHDELNRVEAGQHYGWPYCYDNNLSSPEYKDGKCAAYRAPARLLPAHAAPLGMVFYTAGHFPPAYKNSLIITFHGYRQHGHRLVALMPDRNGAPLGKMVELISDWAAKPGQPMGAPVDVKLGPDGNLYLVEDRPGRVIRLEYQEK